MAIVYVKTDERNRVIDINSDAFLIDLTGWIKIDEGEGDRYVHAQGNYLAKPLYDENGVCRYKYTDNGVEERSEEDKNIEQFPQILENKISELNTICTETIYKGIDVVLSSGSTEHFTLDEHDQSNLLGLALQIAAGAQEVSWHCDDHTQSCKFYSAEDAQTIINALTVYKSYHITYFRDLRIYVYSLVNVTDIKAIHYGFELPEEYKSDVLKYYESLIQYEIH